MPKPYANPYLAGVALGLVLLMCFVLTGQGLGASGAFAKTGSVLAQTAAPQVVAGNDYFRSYLQAEPFWSTWVVVEVLGVFAGAAASAWWHGRFRIESVRGPRASVPQRTGAATLGGVLMGVGAVLACGCTSGQALSGGALLSVGSWVFMIAVFVAGFAMMPLLGRLWR